MANTISSQVLANGPRNLIIKYYIAGDGSGDEANTVLVDVSAYDVAAVALRRVEASLNGFTATLLWDATVNVPAVAVSDYDLIHDFVRYGGLPNDAGAGKTGDILLTTVGLGATDRGSIVLEMVKKDA